VKTGAFEQDGRARNQAVNSAGAFLTFGQWSVMHRLKNLKNFVAFFALVLVNRQWFSPQNRLCGSILSLLNLTSNPF